MSSIHPCILTIMISSGPQHSHALTIPPQRGGRSFQPPRLLDGQLDEPTKDAVPSSCPFIETQRLPAKPRVGKGAYGADLVVITDT